MNIFRKHYRSVRSADPIQLDGDPDRTFRFDADYDGIFILIRICRSLRIAGRSQPDSGSIEIFPYNVKK